MSRWAKQFSRYGRDGFQLARAIFRDSTTKRAVSFKPALLDQARQSNSVAYSLLRMDREIGLVRYYGIMGYFRQHWQARFSSSLPPSTTSTTTMESNENAASLATTSIDADTDTPVPTKARIAFMITASMKQELNEQLGYDLDEHVKKMTPLQASLILHYRIAVEDMDEKLPIVEERYEKKRQEDAKRQQQEAEQLEQQRAQQLAERKQKAEEFKVQGGEANVEGSTTATNTTPKTASAEANTSQDTAGSSLSSIDESPNGTPSDMDPSLNWMSSSPSSSLSSNNGNDHDIGFGDSWYEIVETNPETGETSRVGLYLDEKEAILGLETRQDIAERQGTGKTFAMRSIDRSDVFSSTTSSSNP